MVLLNYGLIYLLCLIKLQVCKIHSNEYPIDYFKNNNNQTDECNKTRLCELCGIYSEKCNFDEFKCSIKCECKTGYTGVYCNDTTVITNSALDENSPKYKLVDEFVYLKELAWSDILNSINDKIEDMELIERAIHKLKRIFEILYFEAKLDTSDAYKYKIILDNIMKQNVYRFNLNEKLFESLYYVMDNLIHLNDFLSTVDRPTVFQELNVKHNNSALDLFKNFENLAKYYRFADQTHKKYFKFKNFESSILLLLPSTQNSIEFQMTTPKDLSQKLLLITQPKKNYLDSIALSEFVLRKLYGNQTIKLSFNIFFNQNNINLKSKEKLTEEEMEFYKEVHSKLAKNFVYEITSSILSNETNHKIMADSYFVSSNVISATIHNQLPPDHKEKIDSIPKLELNKFVRIQFLVNLNQFNIKNDEILLKHRLKCVFWNETSTKWSTNGCRKSIKESQLIEEDYDDRNFYVQVCYCDHLTNFALLFDPLGRHNLDNEFYDEEQESFLDITYLFMYQYVLKYLTLIGIMVSSICYLILIIIRLEFIKKYIYESISKRNDLATNTISSSTAKISSFFSTSSSSLKSSFSSSNSRYKDDTLRQLYLANSICLLIVNILFLINFIVKPHIKKTYRKLNASLLHYFILVSFCFSLGIAWQHFNKLVRIFNQHRIKRKRLFLLNEANFFGKCLAISFFLPSLFAIYGYYSLYLFEDGFYWFKSPYLYYLFVGPLITLLLISLIFYIFVSAKVISIYQKNKMSSRLVVLASYSSYNQKKVIVLLTFSFISLGLTWLLGIFIVAASNSNKYLKLFSDFFFCLFNSFHGLSLLIGNYLARKYSKSDFHNNNNNQRFAIKSILKNTNSTNNTDSSIENLDSNFRKTLNDGFKKFINYLKNSDQICESKAQNSTEPNGDSSIYSKVKPKNNNNKKKSLSFENVDVNYIERHDFNKLKPMSSCENILTQIDNDIKRFVECNKKKYELTNMDDAFTSSV